MRQVLLVACAVFGASVSPVLAYTVHLAAEQMTFVAPDDWVEIPSRVVTQWLAEAKKAVKIQSQINYTHGFQAPARDWFVYPYLLIAPQDVGRYPESELAKLSTFDVQKAMKEEDWGGLISNISASKMLYDPNSRKMWDEIKSSTSSGLRVSGLWMGQVTQRGIVNFYFYATSDRYADLKPLFIKMAASVTPDPEIVYRSDAESPNPLMKGVPEAAIRGAVIGVVFALFAGFGRWIWKRRD